ncbi:LysR family transcriptional regulator [Roseibium sp. MMSF_3544]|uniref:LysR family transcriptional regulator n=1 Tax=unclassified Roseibium TaxID=2629323 RepID=UPI00273D2CB6|nr:LysR family transcriptional regulator [Roseibium sp. MMSF_3544]
MRINFDFNDLDAFLAVMETSSFHHAAERLNLSQSAITRRIQKLEETLGSALFERTTRAVKPTLAAKRLQARAEAMLESARETTLSMRDESVAFAHQRGLVVTIATIPTVISSLLIPAIRSLKDQQDGIRVRLLDHAANEVAEAVSGGEADFGICSIGSLEPNTVFEPLFDDQIVLALPNKHGLAQKQQVSWSDLRQEPLILPARGTGNRLLIDDALARSRLSAQWTYEVGRSTTAMELVNDGLGVALLPRSAVGSVSGRHLKFQNLSNPVVARPVGLLTRVGVSDNSATGLLKSALRRCSQSLGHD